jgi:hypothetical protein
MTSLPVVDVAALDTEGESIDAPRATRVGTGFF